MKSLTTKRFRFAYALLPEHIQKQTKKSYKLWKVNPLHPSLKFKQIHVDEIFSVRITLSYRALGALQADAMIWFWVGNHHAYDKLIASLKK